MKRFKKLIRKILGLDKCYFTELEPKNIPSKHVNILLQGIAPNH